MPSESLKAVTHCGGFSFFTSKVHYEPGREEERIESYQNSERNKIKILLRFKSIYAIVILTQAQRAAGGLQ